MWGNLLLFRESQTYKKSIAEQVKNIKCFKCDSELDEIIFYPNNFINSSGKVDSFDVEVAHSIPEEDSFFRNSIQLMTEIMA